MTAWELSTGLDDWAVGKPLIRLAPNSPQVKHKHFPKPDLRAKCLGWNGIICWVSGLGYSGFLSTSSLRTGTMEGATTGSGIIAASLARETSCESQLESAELGRITLLASITEQNLTLHQSLILTLSSLSFQTSSYKTIWAKLAHFHPTVSQLGMETLVSVTEWDCLSPSTGSFFKFKRI